mmetsp:Transcript_18743/g.52968  ORF Transcript_18743/g.52968 Transcript_18743/m.52968 type:complete len:255 (+) Transcript_18743:89-853(+)
MRSVQEHLRQSCANWNRLDVLDASLAPLHFPLQAPLAPYLLQPLPHLLAVRHDRGRLLRLRLQGELPLQLGFLYSVLSLLFLLSPLVDAQYLRRIWVLALQVLQLSLFRVVGLPSIFALCMATLPFLLLVGPLEGLHLRGARAAGRRLRGGARVPGLALGLAGPAAGGEAAALQALEELGLAELAQPRLLTLKNFLLASHFPFFVVAHGHSSLACIHLPLQQVLLVYRRSALLRGQLFCLFILPLLEQILPLLH